MFRKFFLESWRAKKNRPFSFFINWLGLTLGFAAVIVMYIFIIGQVRHDDCFERPMDDVWRCEVEVDEIGSICPDPLAGFMTRFPEVIAATRAISWGSMTVSVPDQPAGVRFSLSSMFGDSTLLQVLPFRMVSGGGADALADASKGMVSRSAARRLFGSLDVIGKQIEVNNTWKVTITGVFEDVPENSLYTPEVILTFQLANPGDKADKWFRWASECYFRVNPTVDMKTMNYKFQRAVLERMAEAYGGHFIKEGTLDDKIEEAGGVDSPKLPHIRAFDDCYFTPEVTGAMNAYDSGALVVLGIIAVLVLVIAIINYVNIYTARSTEVVRAMGIKSIMGASRGSLIGFIIGDSVLITCVAAVTAFGLAYLLRPLYPMIVGSELSLSLSWDMLLVLFVVLPLVCGVLSGIFPAMVLTRMKPLDAIANRSSGGRQMSAVRNALIVFQFVISIGLIAATLLINKQIRYLTTLDLGYHRENVVMVGGGSFMNREKFNTFRTQLLNSPTIVNASLIQGNPMHIGSMNTVQINEREHLSPKHLYGDQHTLHVLGVPMVEGDSISETNVDRLEWGPSGQMVINEAFAKHIRNVAPEVQIPGEKFVGVFKDFQHQPVTEQVTPLVLVRAWSGDPYIRIAAGQIEPALRHIERTFREMFPNEVFQYEFMDAQFDRMYKQENLFRARLLTFSVLAIFIGCLGLFALVGYSVERRRKEIAIRKVHGATVREVVGMLCLSFLRWLAVSFVIAVPVVWWLMDGWMSRYAYRTTMSWWIFALAGLVAAVIALFTVLGQSYRAAVENPAVAIKRE
ncbi:ABC transporter permease [uncultured Rikenella sp.]|uniref:ABC transporter permease n=1 Tax=uncultured Rikenella sp. TaxID=368003 RepID=UPI0025EAE73F|nr:ABC transporter permease [uncultured Rikenella sp.]